MDFRIGAGLRGVTLQQYSFSTYLVDDSNRAAYQRCHDIAELKPVERKLLVLLGDNGCGKTHLLYSIVNRVRSASATSGLAFVRASDFPQPVRALIHDPSPLDRSPQAILLVDDLESFVDCAEDLEAVIDLFISRQQYVVIATSLHPGRLRDLPEGLLSVLTRAQIVEITAEESASRAQLIDHRIREESEMIIDLQRKEIEGLRAHIAEMTNGPVVPEDESKIRALEHEIAELRVELEDMLSKFDAACEELEGIQAENALMSVSQREVEPLRRKVEELQALRDESQSYSGDGGATRETEEALRLELAEAKAEGLRAETEATELFDRAESLLSEVQKSRELFVQAQSAQSQQMSELKALEAMLAEAGLNIEGLRRGDASLIVNLEHLATEKENIQRELEETIRAHAELQDESTQLGAELASLQKAYREFQVTMIEAAKELDLARAKESQLRRENEQLCAEVSQALQRTESLERDLAVSQLERDEFADTVDKVRFERETLRSELTRASEEESKRHQEQIEVLHLEFLAAIEAAGAQTSEIETKLNSVATELEYARELNRAVVSKMQPQETADETSESEVDPTAVSAESERIIETVTSSDDVSGDEDRELRDAIERLRAYGASHSFSGSVAQAKTPTPRVRPYDPPSFDEVVGEAGGKSRQSSLEPLAPMARPDFGEPTTAATPQRSSVRHVEQLGEMMDILDISVPPETLRGRAEGEDPSI